MSFLIFNPTTLYVAKKKNGDRCVYANRKVAERQLAKLAATRRDFDAADYTVGSYAEFNAADTEITVKNILSGMDVKIRKSQRGTVNDPSMELYHSC